MKSKIILVTLILAVTVACESPGERRVSTEQPAKQSEKTASPPNGTTSHAPQVADGHGHEHGPQTDEVPAFLATAADLKSLKPTLSPELFTGRQRLGYEAAKAIPKTLAQLPCYCRCDTGMGHKSLQSCFVDDHAAHCAVCIDEALVAYQLEKKEGLKADEIRERVVAQFSN